MAKLFRFLAVLAAALPFLIGLVPASSSSPCPHEHGAVHEKMDCPCCDKTNVAASVPCPICIFGVAVADQAIGTRLDVRRVSFAWIDQRADGRAIEPPIPPPRLMDVA
jgi:hypothetical protein